MRRPLLFGRGFRLLGVGASATAALCALPTLAHAQAVDENPPLPNVLLLLDNSGSMERMIDGTLPEANATGTSACTPGTQTLPNRWGTAMQALTGDVQPYYSCVAQPRNVASFQEYQIAGIKPYDSDYFLPYHRPVSWTPPLAGGASSACVFAPGSLPGAPAGLGVGAAGSSIAPPGAYATDFPPGSIVQRVFGTGSTADTCGFKQLTNGALDAANSIMRFGLMTFDSDTTSGVGVTTGLNPTVNTSAPFAGMWSYFPGWDVGAGTPAMGNPPLCAPSIYEVGARNPAAPPWEGRFMTFPSSTANIASVQTSNDKIQLAINAMRPYGATPIGGMMADAQYYFTTDTKGPYQTDNFVKGGCRSQYIILLTDGAPNMDMRAPCSTTSPQTCPYNLPEVTADTLATGPTGQKVTTFVIGFAVSTVQDSGIVQCSSLVAGGTLASVCTNPPANYAACCTLEKIALKGGTGHAYFADSAGALNQALADIFAQIGNQTTTRTVPAYTPGIASPSLDPTNPTPQAATFLSAFNPNIGKPWSGDIQRQQVSCKLAGGNFTVPPPVVTYANGDDFASNLDSHKFGVITKRYFYAVQPGTSGGPVDATATIRPYVSSTPIDNLGNYGGTQYGPDIPTITANVTPSALGITTTQPQCSNNANNQWLSPSDCEKLAFNFVFGQQSTPSLQTNPAPPAAPLPADSNGFLPFKSRYCETNCLTGNPDKSAFGDIFHATPTVVSRPQALLRDESYQLFTAQNSTRKSVVYSATNDGILHAFWADVKKQESNELWAFLPPAVLPGLIGQYPSSHSFLLDGAPVVKDVVFERKGGTSGNSVIVNSADWHTMLVASFGSQGRGYYAVDVTSPDPTVVPAGKPKFQWQLTAMPGGAQNILGVHSATPAITTIFADPDGNGVREIGVAILAGGYETGATSGAAPLGGPSCARSGPVSGTGTATPAPASGSTYTARAAVRCWGATRAASDPVIGRSVSVVRLDTGEIIQVFMRAADLPPTHPLKLSTKSILKNTFLDSPMTGTPVVYPADTGAIAQKAFITDADGTIWKFDLTATDPTQWTGEIFFDAWNTTVDTDTTNSWNHGNPIQVAPVVALDRTGSLVLGVATGDQESYTPLGTNYIYSISEKIQGASPPKLRAQANWYQTLITGERVSGPMVVFDGALYLATFKPSDTGGCAAGAPSIWGMDYQNPKDLLDASKGGAPRLLPGPVQFIDPTGGSPTSPIAGKVIPGVSINVTPACADLSSTGNDGYVFGTQHTTASNVTGGSYSLFTQVGGKSSGNLANTAIGTFSMPLPTPQTATIVDSWAAVVE